MKNYRKLGLLSILVAAGMFVGGCALEKSYDCDSTYQYPDPDQYGNCLEFDAEHCGYAPDGEMIDCTVSLQNASNSGVACINFGQYDDNNKLIKSDYKCSANKCVPAFHLEKQDPECIDSDTNDLQKCVKICASDTAERCGDDLLDCTEGATEGYCIYHDGKAKCEIKDCRDEYFYDKHENACKRQSDRACGKNAEDCTIRDSVENGEWKCENQVCVVNCKINNYKYINNACRLDCNSNQEPRDGICVDICPEGTHLNPAPDMVQTNCTVENKCCLPNNTSGFNTEAKEAGHCGAQDVDCKSIEGVISAICIDPANPDEYADRLEAHMEAWENDYNDPLLSDAPTCTELNDANARKKAAKANELRGYKYQFVTESQNYSSLKCNALECDTANGFRLKYDEEGKYYKCEQSSTTDCGSDRIDCTKEPFWDDGKCFVDKDEDGKGICVAEKCKPGGYLDIIKCKPNTTANCGEQKCDGNLYCEDGECVAKCSAGKTEYKGVCFDKQTSIQYCGDNFEQCIANHREKHESQRNCENGVCVLTECLKGYHKYNDPEKGMAVCEANTNKCCGESRTDCTQNGSQFSIHSNRSCDVVTGQCVSGTVGLYNGNLHEDYYVASAIAVAAEAGQMCAQEIGTDPKEGPGPGISIDPGNGGGSGIGIDPGIGINPGSGFNPGNGGGSGDDNGSDDAVEPAPSDDSIVP